MPATRASKAISEWLLAGTDEEPRNQIVLAARIGRHLRDGYTQSSISKVKDGLMTPSADVAGAIQLEIGIPAEWWLEYLDDDDDVDDDAA